MSIDQEFQEKLRKHFKKEGQDVKIIYLKLLNSGYIARFREGWGLPADGFLSTNNYYKWRGSFLNKRTNNYIRGKEYKKMQDKMRKLKLEYGRGKILHDDIDEYGWKMRLSEPLFRFEWDIDLVITKLGIPERYAAFVEGALTMKSPPDYFMIDRPLPKPFLRTDPNTGRKKLLIETYGDTKLEDFRSKVFAHHFKKLQPKAYDYGTIKKLGVSKFDIWEQLAKWRGERKSYKEIRELAQSELGFFIKYPEQVKVYLNRFKKLGYTRKKKV